MTIKRLVFRIVKWEPVTYRDDDTIKLNFKENNFNSGAKMIPS